MRRAGKKSKTHKMTRGKKRMPRHVQERRKTAIEHELDREVDKIFQGNLHDQDDPYGEYD